MYLISFFSIEKILAVPYFSIFNENKIQLYLIFAFSLMYDLFRTLAVLYFSIFNNITSH